MAFKGRMAVFVMSRWRDKLNQKRAGLGFRSVQLPSRVSRVRIPSPAPQSQKAPKGAENNDSGIHNLLPSKYKQRVLEFMLLSKSIKFYIDSLYAERKSQRTIEIYTLNLSLFTKHTGDIKLQDLSAVHIRAFLAMRSENCEPATVHSAFRSIRTFCNWNVREGFLEKTPFVNIKAPKLDKKIIATYSKIEIQSLLLQCNDKSFLGSRNKALISILLDSGIRESEITNLDTKSIDFRSGIIRVKGKGRKERIVKISDKAIKALGRYMFLREDQIAHVDRPDPKDKVFLSEEGRALTRTGLLTIIRKLGKSAGVKAYIHKFRHTFAIEWLRSGGDIKTLQNILGHENINTTTRYLTALNEDDIINSHRQFSPGDKFL